MPQRLSLGPAGDLVGVSVLPDAEYDLHLLDPDGGRPVRLTPEDGSSEEPVGWSGDGRFVYSEGQGEDGHSVINVTRIADEGDVPRTWTVLSVPGEDVRFLTAVGAAPP